MSRAYSCPTKPSSPICSPIRCSRARRCRADPPEPVQIAGAAQRRRGAAGGDNTNFLRESGIVVTIEHDLEQHLDRAIELINRTNQLNFTKLRLPEDIGQARAELRNLLSDHSVQAGILRVRDRYGDYGYCGLYIMNSGSHSGVELKLRHFCFSCRIMNMGVETWLYRRLGSPAMRQKGELLTDVVQDTRDINWITVQVPGAGEQLKPASHVIDYVFARGACDLRAVTHYFHMVAGEVHGEFNTVEDGIAYPLHHSVFAGHALNGLRPAVSHAFARLGYKPEHFYSVLPSLPKPARAVWLLSFWGDTAYALYKHNASGSSIPIVLPKFRRKLANILEMDPAESGMDQKTLSWIQDRFSFEGMIKEADFKASVRLMLSYATPQTHVFILQANNEMPRKNNVLAINPKRARVNRWLTELAAELPIINLLRIGDFVAPGEAADNPNHFDRTVYFRIYEEIMRRVQNEDQQDAAD